MMEERRFNQKMEVIAGELRTFYHQKGGSWLLPDMIPGDAGPEFMSYFITDDDSKASILLRPTQNGGCVMTINYNDTVLGGWLLGVPGRSELGETTRLAAETSKRCVNFCNEFVAHLETRGFVDISNPLPVNLKPKGGRPRHPENEWAKQQILEGRNRDIVFDEWREKRRAALQLDFHTLKLARDAFRKAIR